MSWFKKAKQEQIKIIEEPEYEDISDILKDKLINKSWIKAYSIYGDENNATFCYTNANDEDAIIHLAARLKITKEVNYIECIIRQDINKMIQLLIKPDTGTSYKYFKGNNVNMLYEKLIEIDRIKLQKIKDEYDQLKKENQENFNKYIENLENIL